MNIFISGVLAFCSLGYSFIFSHLLAITLGATLVQYCVGLGLYISSLGMGSICFDKYSASKRHCLQNKLKFLLRIEILICLTAFAGCFFILANSQVVQSTGVETLKLFSYIPTLILGFFSGMELPVLIDHASEKESKWILSADFLGMSLMCLAFGFLIVPLMGFINALLFFIFINFATVMLLRVKSEAASSLASLVFAAVVAGLLYLPQWEAVLRHLYMGSGQ